VSGTLIFVDDSSATAGCSPAFPKATSAFI
jgi:hypothetical protein